MDTRPNSFVVTGAKTNSSILWAQDPTHSLRVLSPTHSSYGCWTQLIHCFKGARPHSFATGAEPKSLIIRVLDPTHSLRALSPTHADVLRELARPYWFATGAEPHCLKASYRCWPTCLSLLLLRPFHTRPKKWIQCASNAHFACSHLNPVWAMRIRCASSQSTSGGGLEPNRNRIHCLFIE